MANEGFMALTDLPGSVATLVREDGLLKVAALAAVHGSQAFHDLLREMADLHERKAKDYGDPATGDVFANIRKSAAAVGVESWRAAFLRALDKVHRISEFAKRGTLANEGVEDSLMDLAAYAMIALLMLREAEAAKSTR